jgi:peptidoglycan/xylan/chitin deacetylase (PgdA/CDA1 family)
VIIKTPNFIRFFFPSLIWHKKNLTNSIWLTFDDGPSEEVTPFILNVLKEENIKATFFLVGEQIQKNPFLMKEIMADGHKLANHSFSHKNGWMTKNSNYFDDIEKCQKLLPVNKLFRPPYGKINPIQINYLKKKIQNNSLGCVKLGFFIKYYTQKNKKTCLKKYYIRINLGFSQ